MLKNWQRKELAHTLNVLAEKVADIKTTYFADDYQKKIQCIDAFGVSVMLSDDEAIHNLRVYTNKLYDYKVEEK